MQSYQRIRLLLLLNNYDSIFCVYVCGQLWASSWSGAGLAMGHHLPFLISCQSHALSDYFPWHPSGTAVGVEGPDPPHFPDSTLLWDTQERPAPAGMGSPRWQFNTNSLTPSLCRWKCCGCRKSGSCAAAEARKRPGLLRLQPCRSDCLAASDEPERLQSELQQATAKE